MGVDDRAVVDPMAVLFEKRHVITHTLGVIDRRFMEKALKALNDRIERYSKETDIKGTPTFVINGKKMTDEGGEAPLAQLDAAIAAASK